MCAKSNSQIRITSGEFSGRYIDTPKNSVTQPMGERERLAIFNQIRDYLPGAKVLDAFAGSGVLGLTALSNSAAAVDFLENNPEAIKTIKNNLIKLKYNKNENNAKKTEIKIFRKTSELTENYDLIFADPPYDNPQYEILEPLIAHLTSGGILVLSHPQSPEPPTQNGLQIISDRSYAAAHIKIYQKK